MSLEQSIRKEKKIQLKKAKQKNKKMLIGTSAKCCTKSQRCQNSPDANFFNSDNFLLLDRTQKRKAEAKKVARDHQEDTRGDSSDGRLAGSVRPESGYYSELYRADGNPRSKRRPHHDQRPTFFGLRRPLNALEQRTVDALPVWEKSHEEWTDKPFSTVFVGTLGYIGHFPLLMQISSEAEDKDVTVIQTETRRMSMVTTDYASGTIKLQSDEEDVKYAVFPILHMVVDSESGESSYCSTSSDTDPKSSTSDADSDAGDRTPENCPPPLLPEDVLQRLADIAAQRTSDDDGDDGSTESEDEEWIRIMHRRLHADRRMAITTRPCAEKPRMLKRISLDFGSLFYHHEFESMDTIEEDSSATPTPTPTTITADANAGKVESGLTSTLKCSQAGTWAKSAKAKAKAFDSRLQDVSMLVRRAELSMNDVEFRRKLKDFEEPSDSSEDSHDDSV